VPDWAAEPQRSVIFAQALMMLPSCSEKDIISSDCLPTATSVISFGYGKSLAINTADRSEMRSWCAGNHIGVTDHVARLPNTCDLMGRSSAQVAEFATAGVLMACHVVEATGAGSFGG